MLKQILINSLGISTTVIIGHSIYYKSKGNTSQNCSLLKEESINRNKLLSENSKQTLIQILKDQKM